MSQGGRTASEPACVGRWCSDRSFVTPPRLPPGAGGGFLRAWTWTCSGTQEKVLPGPSSSCLAFGELTQRPSKKPAQPVFTSEAVPPQEWSLLELTALSVYPHGFTQSLGGGRPGTADTCCWGIPGGVISWCKALSCPGLESVPGLLPASSLAGGFPFSSSLPHPISRFASSACCLGLGFLGDGLSGAGMAPEATCLTLPLGFELGHQLEILVLCPPRPGLSQLWFCFCC